MLLIGASIATSVPWMSLQRQMSQISLPADDDEQEQKNDEEDSKDDREERNDNEERYIDKDFLASESIVHFFAKDANFMNAFGEESLSHPNFDIVVPPPKSIC
jgi:hypothetical protein